MWRHSHNVCCGETGTTNIIVFFLVLSLQYMMGSLSRKEVLSLLELLLSVFCWNSRYQYFVLLFLFYLYVCNYLQFCCILYSDHSFTLNFFLSQNQLGRGIFFFIDPIKYWYKCISFYMYDVIIDSTGSYSISRVVFYNIYSSWA